MTAVKRKLLHRKRKRQTAPALMKRRLLGILRIGQRDALQIDGRESE